MNILSTIGVYNMNNSVNIYKIVYLDSISQSEYICKIFATSTIGALKTFIKNYGARYTAKHVYQLTNNTLR